jgi:hypothetical protein
MWGCHKTFNTNDMVKVDQALGRRFPHLLTDEYVIRGDPVGHQQQTVLSFSPLLDGPPIVFVAVLGGDRTTRGWSALALFVPVDAVSGAFTVREYLFASIDQ